MAVTGVTKLEKGIKPQGEVGLGSSRAFSFQQNHLVFCTVALQMLG